MMNSKSQIRKDIKNIIKANKKDFVIDELIEFINEKNIAVYLDIKNEISIDNVINNIKNKCNLFVPYMKDDGTNKIENALLVFKKYDLNKLCFDDFNIKSSNGEVIDIKDLDMIIIPGLAFNHLGYRMGYGKGCYDKALKNYDKMIIGVCYDNCFIDVMFHEEHDIRVDYVFTEKRFIKIRG